MSSQLSAFMHCLQACDAIWKHLSKRSQSNLRQRSIKALIPTIRGFSCTLYTCEFSELTGVYTADDWYWMAGGAIMERVDYRNKLRVT